VSSDTLEVSKRRSLLIVLGSSSALAQQVVPAISDHSMCVGVSTKRGKISHAGEPRRVLLYNSEDPDSLSRLIGSTEIPERSGVAAVSFISFTGAKDTELLVNITSTEIHQLVNINFTVNAVAAGAIVRKFRGIPVSMIFMSSAGALSGGVGTTLYSASKMALNALARGIAVEYGRFGVRANVLSLGLTEIGLAESVPSKVKAMMLARTAQGKPVSLAGIVSSVNYLLGENETNGAVLPCDGGFFA
jgi:NAD(P)-dependent dehydrogenase (short-subunit alcohol dehydrogenase family)